MQILERVLSILVTVRIEVKSRSPKAIVRGLLERWFHRERLAPTVLCVPSDD